MTNKQRIALTNLDEFQHHTHKLVSESRRQLLLFSHYLDEHIYEQDHFCEAFSALARSSRYINIQVLVKNTQHLAERGHKLLRIAQRMSSKITLRKLHSEAECDEGEFLLGDNHLLLYRNDYTAYNGYVNYHAQTQSKNQRETFERWWQCSEEDPQLRLLYL